MWRHLSFLLFATAHHLPFEHAALFGSIDLGYYYVDLHVGTPPVKQTVIVDTGSSVTAFPCTGCTNCGSHMDYYFDYTKSNTSRVIQCGDDVPCGSCVSNRCHYYQGYAEGSSISGYYIEDYVQLGDDTVADRVKFVFGCHDAETRLFRTQLADGIMGLAFTKGARHIQTIIDVLFKDHGVSTDVFSLCFGLRGGFMTVGGVNQSLHSAPMQTANLYHSTFYSVKLRSISVNDTLLNISEGEFGFQYDSGTIIDSGTTFVYLASAVYSKFWMGFREYCTKPNRCSGRIVAVSGESNPCYHNTYSNLTEFFETFPTLYMRFDNATVPWKPRSYLFSWSESPNDYCVGVYNNGGGGSVLGALFMRGLDVLFNRENATIGFATSDCDAQELLGDGRRLWTDRREPQPQHRWELCGYTLVAVLLLLAAARIMWKQRTAHSATPIAIDIQL